MTYTITLLRSIFRSGLLLVAGSAISTAIAQSIDSERDRIAKARLQVQTTYEQDLAQCKRQFAVTDCEQRVAKTKRVQLDQLNREELVLKDQERKTKAAKKIKKLDERSQLKESSAAQNDPNERTKKIKLAKPKVAETDSVVTEHRKAEIEKLNEAKFQDKLRSTQAHQEKVRQANQSRIKPAASSLLVPQ